MGGGESKQEETKTVDSTGAVNNNVVVTNPVNIRNMDIMILLWLIGIIKVIELILYMYKTHQRTMKKKYTNNPA